ncbi:MAG: ABC transporter substrate-binding protein [Deltaproteobacteria bacterium]|nr:ABC transporter substrate-binding protein [Deltaproteobacteria bacterium]
MQLTFAHFRNRFCMFRTYYALAKGLIRPDGFDLAVIETADPPSAEQIELLVSGAVDVADLYLPSFLAQKLKGAPIVGIGTEWKTTLRGNGIFVRADSPIKIPQELGGCVIGTHQVLIDQIFCLAERDRELRCLYTDGEGWKALTGYSEMVKHIIAVREPLLKAQPELRGKLLAAFRASLQYSREHLEEIAEEFIERYGGEKEVLLASVQYPKIEFTFTKLEQTIAEAEMEMLFEMGFLSGRIAVAPQFVL